MVRANNRLPSSVSVSRSSLDGVSLTLQGLPEKPKANWSLREAISALQESIRTALGKGYSYEEVSKMLSAKGIKISASSLKSYLSAAKRQNNKPISKGQKSRRQIQKSQTDELNLNGSAAAAKALNTNQPRSKSKIVPSSSDAELSARETTQRQAKSTATLPPTRKTAAKSKPAVATTTKAVSKAKATSKATSKTASKTASSRGQKKSS
jgi:hypothetical protein